jgi:hypothetical protein
MLHSHAVAPAHFASPGLCYAKPLYGLAKRRKQPERYAQFLPKLIDENKKQWYYNQKEHLWKTMMKLFNIMEIIMKMDV